MYMSKLFKLFDLQTQKHNNNNNTNKQETTKIEKQTKIVSQSYILLNYIRPKILPKITRWWIKYN